MASTCDSQTVLMVHANEANHSTTPADSSASAHTLTAVGAAEVTTSQIPPLTGATGSLNFNGTNSYFSTPSSADYNFGTSDFCIDFWVRFQALSGNPCLFTRDAAGGGGITRIGYATAGASLNLYLAGSLVLNPSWSPSLNTWYHLEVDRSGTALAIYIDGSSIGTAVNSSNVTGSDQLELGDDAAGFNFLNGQLGEVRVTKGLARHTANFTRPSVQYCGSTKLFRQSQLSGIGAGGPFFQNPLN